MNQRERFEAAWRRAYPDMHPIVLDHSALGYTESWVDQMWQGFQAGESSDLIQQGYTGESVKLSKQEKCSNEMYSLPESIE